METCLVCDAPTSSLGIGQILGRYAATYECCDVCSFTFIRNPHWLGEAYSSAITAVDLGVVSRCDQFSSLLKTIIHSYANPNGQFLDYGGGYGMLVRRMRDLGYDYYWADKHCENLFASGFDVTHRTEDRYELLTACEVFEHLTDPVGEMEVMTGLADQIVFSTDMISRPPPAPGTWWYYGPEHGQHISFYTWETLNRLARRFNLHFATNGVIHMYSKRRIDQRFFATITKPCVNRLINLFLRRKSLLNQDFENARKSALENQINLGDHST